MWCNGARLVLCIFQDPSRNHRAYRLAVAKLTPPYIPFMPLLLKGNRCQQLYGGEHQIHSQMTSFLSIPRHDIHQWGKSKLRGQIGQLWENGEVEILLERLLSIIIPKTTCHQNDFNLFLRCSQRMIAKTVKIVRGCRSQPYGKWTSWEAPTKKNKGYLVYFNFFFCSTIVSTEGPGRPDVSGRACNAHVHM